MPIEYRRQPDVTADMLYEPSAPYGERVELWHGEPIEMSPADWRHSDCVIALIALLHPFISRKKGLFIGSETAAFRLRSKPDLLFCPDVAVYAEEARRSRPWLTGAPLVAIEVLSPSNTPAEMASKKRHYLEAGAAQVWLVDPGKNRLEIHFADGRLIEATSGILAGEGILEGLSINLDALFADPE